jgi:hypothetical protein
MNNTVDRLRSDSMPAALAELVQVEEAFGLAIVKAMVR